jgi:tagatose-1,6-bisphosphate aldolase
MTKDYEENIDTLITFGEEGHTLRKDDPRTKEAIKKNNKILEDKLKEMIANDEVSVFEGINLYSKREDDEDYGEYKQRMKLIKNLQKIYSKLGREECKLQYPQGFAYALNQALVEENSKTDIKINNDESN